MQAQAQASPHISLLELDPDLGELLAGERAAAARRDLRVLVAEVPPGPWRPDALLPPARTAVGALLVKGVAWRATEALGEGSAELLGRGDLVRTWHDQDHGEHTRWQAMTALTVGLLDTRTTVALARYPEVWLTLLERVEARAERLVATQAISQMTGVDARLEALFHHLSERWGKVCPDGVRIPLNLSHRQLGALVGARRPTVSTAIALLAHQHRVARGADGTWLLPRTEPALRLEPVAA
jgi:hypothetical protein